MQIGSEKQQGQMITDQRELMATFLDIEQRCFKLDNFQEPGMTLEAMIQKLMLVLQSIKDFQMFSSNQTLKEVHTQHLKLLTLPYHIGWLYGRLRQPRMKAVTTSKDFLNIFLSLMEQFTCEQQQIFPKNLQKMWHSHSKQPSYRPPRQELVQAMKDRKMIEKRYAQSQKIKQESDRRDSIKSYMMIKIHESITLLRSIEEEISILKYKQSIQKDPIAKEEHQNQLNKPIPKIKVWEIPAKDQVKNCMCPTTTKKELIAQVWQENANKPTMTLEEVGELEYQNALDREKRQAKYREQNKEDTDSDKEDVDARQKKKARDWDDWKDEHQKGAGNKNGR